MNTQGNEAKTDCFFGRWRSAGIFEKRFIEKIDNDAFFLPLTTGAATTARSHGTFYQWASSRHSHSD
jgi:hypothetical protein